MCGSKLLGCYTRQEKAEKLDGTKRAWPGSLPGPVGVGRTLAGIAARLGRRLVLAENINRATGHDADPGKAGKARASCSVALGVGTNRGHSRIKEHKVFVLNDVRVCYGA
jgi:hypothetical protein